MAVLFSPIGNSDPWRNNRDGAMLNIVRTYQPIYIKLFFTRSIWEDRSNRDGYLVLGHKHFDWVSIIQSVSPHSEVNLIIEEVEGENNYDSYKDTFHSHLTELINNFPDEELLINVTSGTPQMGATLCLEYVTSPEHKKCLQVSTPARNSNASSKFAVSDMQEIDLEIVNEEEKMHKHRCSEIEILSFRETMVKGQLISLIDHYDYHAAFFLVAQNTYILNASKIKSELKEISENIQMHRVFKELIDEYPGRYNAPLRLALMHTILLNMRYKRRDYAEVLIRLKSLAEFIVEQHLKKVYPQLIKYRKYHGRLSPFYNRDFSKSFTERYEWYLRNKGWELDERKVLGFVNYLDLLELLNPNDLVLTNMRVIEKVNDLRNGVAHRLEELDIINHTDSTNPDSINQKISDAVKIINELLYHVFPKLNQDASNFLDKKNEMIKRLLMN